MQEHTEDINKQINAEYSKELNDELSAEENAELERLWEEHKKRLAEDGGVWPEYTGDGK